ncbi:MAG: hypothetical protein WD396_09010, partial [Pseudohongiellaceae bacterium]
TAPERPAADSLSAAWLEPGPYTVGQVELTFVDESRRTAANGEAPGAPSRTLPSTLWYPRDYDGDSLPLIVHSHGILSSRTEMPYLMEALASRGYVVVATDYPLTSGGTPGGANAADVVNQPGDVSFLIDSVLALDGADKPFNGPIDGSRIGLSGYSLGGLTTLLSTYHAELRDPRVSAAVAIAGPSAVFAPLFFETTAVPFLAVAGTADALIEYERNAADLTARADNLALVGIEAGSHLGFADIAEPAFRFMETPDSLGCSAVLAALGENPNALFDELGTAAIGVDRGRDLPGICEDVLQPALHPGRQQMITQVAIVSFFESVFSPDGEQRELAAATLTEALAADFAEARVRR